MNPIRIPAPVVGAGHPIVTALADSPDVPKVHRLTGAQVLRYLVGELLETLVDGILGDHAEGGAAALTIIRALEEQAGRDYDATVAGTVGKRGAELRIADAGLEALRHRLQRLDALRRHVEASLPPEDPRLPATGPRWGPALKPGEEAL